MTTILARSVANAFLVKKFGRWKRIETAEKHVQIVDDDLVAPQKKAFVF